MKVVKTMAMAAVVVSLSLVDSEAGVVRVEVVSRTEVAGGQSFGLAGPYERIEGKVYFSVYPENPHNKIVVDLDRAPRNNAGQVEFSDDLYLLRPKDASLGNGALIYGVTNRGNRGLPFNRRSPDPGVAREVGDGFLMAKGFTVVWSGWQFDLPDRENLMKLQTPTATNDGQPIEGLTRTDFVTVEKVYQHSLADRYMVPNPAIDPDGPDSMLTVRDTIAGERRVIPRRDWDFARLIDGQVVRDPNFVYLSSGFEPGKIYEVVWLTHNPKVAGLGLASVRDLVSFFKYEKNELVEIDRAYAFGTSQSGRFLREFIYTGFNADERNRQVFDGIIPNVAAQGNRGMKHRFSQPSRGAHPFMIAFFTATNLFPFTDVTQTDPETGQTDGMLAYYEKNPAVMPKIFYPNASNEYWGRAAALIHTTIDGKRDIEIPENVRIYFFSGTGHGPGAFPPVRNGIEEYRIRGQHKNNPNDFHWSFRALLLAMDRWVTEGTLPPPSQYPRIDDGTLVPLESVSFPKIPGVELPRFPPMTYRVNFGPRFKTEEIIDFEPPKVGNPYPLLQPQVDADGNELAGIRLPCVEVPLATYTGWNLRAHEIGAPDQVAGLVGSYIPFARTRSERDSTGDPRPSIEERYRDRDQYLGLYTEAVLRLIEKGYLLSEDLSVLVEHGKAHWDYALKDSPSP